MHKENVVVFASGTAEGGGSGFRSLVCYAQHSGAGYRVCAVVSDHLRGGVHKLAGEFSVPFVHFSDPFGTPSRYREIIQRTDASWVMLSGWLKRVRGVEPARTVNVHPALLSFDNRRFGGDGLYGRRVHEKVHEALQNGDLDEKGKDGKPLVAHSGFAMHFVTDTIDGGPIFAEVRTVIKKEMSAQEIGETVSRAERRWQPMLLDMVIKGQIRLQDALVQVPYGYGLLPK